MVTSNNVLSFPEPKVASNLSLLTPAEKIKEVSAGEIKKNLVAIGDALFEDTMYKMIKYGMVEIDIDRDYKHVIMLKAALSALLCSTAGLAHQLHVFTEEMIKSPTDETKEK